MNWSKNYRLVTGIMFSLIPDFMPVKKTWRDFVPNITIAMVCVFIFVVLLELLVHELNRPVVNQSYTTGEIKSVDIGGEVLYPSDPRFEKSKLNAAINWVQ